MSMSDNPTLDTDQRLNDILTWLAAMGRNQPVILRRPDDIHARLREDE